MIKLATDGRSSPWMFSITDRAIKELEFDNLNGVSLRCQPDPRR